MSQRELRSLIGSTSAADSIVDDTTGRVLRSGRRATVSSDESIMSVEELNERVKEL